MNWDQVEGKWTEIVGKVRTTWGHLTDQDLEEAKGRRDQLIGKLQQRYGKSREWAEQQVDTFIAQL